MSVEIGIALFPEHARDIQALFQKAEVALADARNNITPCAIYSDQSTPGEFNTWDIEVELQNALERDEFELYFQPQVCMQTGHVFGAEALIRWNNAEHGFIRPDIFIPVAERDGQIHSITWWTINTALRLIKDWPVAPAPLKVAVNLSTKVLKDPDIVDAMRSALNLWGNNQGRVTLEITESAFMEDMSASFVTLDKLKALGLNISIDDFGYWLFFHVVFQTHPGKRTQDRPVFCQ